MPPTDLQSLWMIAIGKQTRHRIQVAVGKCIRRHPTWPPTIPEFVALCDVDAEELGLPDNETAWLEAQRKAGMASTGWSHLAIKQAVRKTGSYDIQKATTKGEQESVKKRFTIEYNSIARAMANGQQLIESDQTANPDRYIERKMVEEGNRIAAEAGFSGYKGEPALQAMKEMLRNRK